MGQEGYNGGATLKQIRQIWTRCFNNVLLNPLLESAKTKHRRHLLKPLDEVFALRLGAVVTMVPVQASGRQRHGVAKVVTLLESRDRVMRSM